MAGTTGRIVVSADVAALGTIDKTGWHPTDSGAKSLQRLSRLAHVPVTALVNRIRRSVVRSPFAPAVVLPHPTSALANYVDERAAKYPGFNGTWLPARSYPQGAFGSTFLGLLGEVSDKLLASPRYRHAKAGEMVGVSGRRGAVRQVS